MLMNSVRIKFLPLKPVIGKICILTNQFIGIPHPCKTEKKNFLSPIYFT